MMKKSFCIMISVIGILFGLQTAMAEEAPPAVRQFAESTLTAFATDQILITAVKDENAKGKTLDDIKRLDQQWTSTAGIADFMQTVLGNKTAEYLDAIQNKADYYEEIFLMDNQGALVAATDKTSDYWQGDEDKFTVPYSTGDILISEVAFDSSSQAYLVQVSLPIKEGDKAIGAITFGINLDKFE